MKKIFVIIVILVMSLRITAQEDAFFNWNANYDRGTAPSVAGTPSLPEFNGGNQTAVAPLGSGLLVLTALGAGYAVARRRRKEDKRY